MSPIRQGDGTGLSVPGYSEVRTGDGRVLWTAGGDIPDSGVSRWLWDNSAADIWGDNDGTESGAISYTSGPSWSDAAIIANGSDTRIDLPSDTFDTLSGDWSIAFWINIDSIGGGVVSLRPFDADINVSSGPVVEFDSFDGSSISTTATSTLSTNTWYHIVVAYSNGTATIFVDGSEDVSQSHPEPRQSGSGPAFLVDRFNSHSDINLGTTDLYSKELTASETSNLYNTGSI